MRTGHDGDAASYIHHPGHHARLLLPGWIQVQTLLEIHNLEWCDLYYWTAEGGSTVTHIKRDRRYWEILYKVVLT